MSEWVKVEKISWCEGTAFLTERTVCKAAKFALSTSSTGRRNRRPSAGQTGSGPRLSQTGKGGTKVVVHKINEKAGFHGSSLNFRKTNVMGDGRLPSRKKEMAEQERLAIETGRLKPRREYGPQGCL